MKDYTYEVDIDGKHLDITSFLMYNWSTSHDKEDYTYPFCAVNDGLLEMAWVSKPGIDLGDFTAAGKRKKKGYMSGYEGHSLYTVTRGKKMKVTFKARDGQASDGRMIPLGVDGEPMAMKRFYTVEVIPEGIEYMFDPRYFDRNNWFN